MQFNAKYSIDALLDFNAAWKQYHAVPTDDVSCYFTWLCDHVDGHELVVSNLFNDIDLEGIPAHRLKDAIEHVPAARALIAGKLSTLPGAKVLRLKRNLGSTIYSIMETWKGRERTRAVDVAGNEVTLEDGSMYWHNHGSAGNEEVDSSPEMVPVMVTLLSRDGNDTIDGMTCNRCNRVIVDSNKYLRQVEWRWAAEWHPPAAIENEKKMPLVYIHDGSDRMMLENVQRLLTGALVPSWYSRVDMPVHPKAWQFPDAFDDCDWYVIMASDVDVTIDKNDGNSNEPGIANAIDFCKRVAVVIPENEENKPGKVPKSILHGMIDFIPVPPLEGNAITDAMNVADAIKNIVQEPVYRDDDYCDHLENADGCPHILPNGVCEWYLVMPMGRNEGCNNESYDDFDDDNYGW